MQTSRTRVALAAMLYLASTAAFAVIPKVDKNPPPPIAAEQRPAASTQGSETDPIMGKNPGAPRTGTATGKSTDPKGR